MRKMATSIIVVAVLLVVLATSVSAEKYEVEKGDSLWKIAKQYETTINELVSLNDLKTTVIQPKQQITINETYIVERGDTLSHIAQDFDVKPKQIKTWNELESDLILIGEELVIKQGEKVEASKEEQTPERKSEPVAANSEQDDPIAEKETSEQAEQTTNEEQKPAGETLEVTATAYTAKCEGCSGITYTGVDLTNDRDKKVIAVDPDVIPLGTKVYVEDYGYAVAEDIGSAIKGNKIDLHVPTEKEAFNWGVQTVNVTILD